MWSGTGGTLCGQQESEEPGNAAAGTAARRPVRSIHEEIFSQLRKQKQGAILISDSGDDCRSDRFRAWPMHYVNFSHSLLIELDISIYIRRLLELNYFNNLQFLYLSFVSRNAGITII